MFGKTEKKHGIAKCVRWSRRLCRGLLLSFRAGGPVNQASRGKKSQLKDSPIRKQNSGKAENGMQSSSGYNHMSARKLQKLNKAFF